MAGRGKDKSAFELPKYLMLNKGSMWFDTEGENASGIKLFAFNKVFVGRETKLIKKEVEDHTFQTTEVKYDSVATEVPKDKFGNDNALEWGYIEKELPWFVDVSAIPQDKLSRVIIAYNHKVLITADPTKPPMKEVDKETREFTLNKDGDRVFIGGNEEMYKKLQNLNFEAIQAFITTCPMTSTGRNNLIDLLDYEQKGHNALSRPRLEVLDALRKKLREMGPGISPIRINEEK